MDTLEAIAQRRSIRKFLGYPDEAPKARPRKPVDEVNRWL